MGGAGITTPELVAAVSNAGGLGSMAAAYLSPDAIETQGRRVRELTGRPFAVNLFAPQAGRELAGDVEAQLRLLGPIHERLGIAPPLLPQRPAVSFEEQLEAVLSLRPAIVSFTFGILPGEALERLRARDIYLIGTATTVAEAKMLEEAGVDAVVAQGAEAGAHRGTFAVDPAAALVGTIALVPQIADAMRLPVIASGGIMDGRGIVAALALGAAAVQMGTAFLTSAESGAAEVYKRAVVEATDDGTSLTRAYSGRWARGLRTHFMAASERCGAEPLPYPWQNALTGAMRAAAARQGEREYLSLWAGQGAALARRTGVAELMAALEREMREACGKVRAAVGEGVN